MGLRGPEARPVEDRFAEKVGAPTEAGCTEWTAGTNGVGYGLLRLDPTNGSKRVYAQVPRMCPRTGPETQIKKPKERSMTMDMTDSIAPKSDQLDAVDLLSGPRTFTIEKVTANNPEQPFNFHLAEFPRVWRPGKSMRRVIVAAWGPDASKYTGQSLTLYCDPSVMFGGVAVGGTRISHMTGIDKALKVPLLVTKGRSALFTVQPLQAQAKAPKQPARDWLAEAQLADGDTDLLRTLWKAAQAAGEPKETLNAIFAMTNPIAAPSDEPAPV